LNHFEGYRELGKLFDISLLYVLSGTGNTYRVACWIRDFFEKNEIKARLKLIGDADFKVDFHNSDRQLIAVLFPTHGFMPPWVMIKFLFRMPRQKKALLMSVATRGAFWVGPLKIPGSAGFSNFFVAMILLCKGYDIRGFFSLDMAANMNNLHPCLNPDTVKKNSEKTKNRIDFFLFYFLLTPLFFSSRSVCR